MNGLNDLIPIALALVGAVVVLRAAGTGLYHLSVHARDALRRLRSRRADTGRSVLVQRMDGLESRMDSLESSMQRIIKLLETPERKAA